MTITVHRDLIQGSDEWLAARCGLLTASEMHLVVTEARLKPASNDKSRAHLHELAAQRITKHVEPSFISDDMLRGLEEEQPARELYAEKFAPVEEIGFVTQEFSSDDGPTFTLGASPDGFVGDDGTLEIKAPRQKSQFATIVFGEMPKEHVIQVQTGLLVSGRSWCDFISYHGGMPMIVVRVHADAEIHAAILDAATLFHEKLEGLLASYRERVADKASRLVATERREKLEIHV